MSRERRKHFIKDWMIVRGYDLRTLAEKSGLSVKTVMRIRDGESYYPKSFALLCAGLGITGEEAYVNPYDLLQQKHLRGDQNGGPPQQNEPARTGSPPPRDEPECIDIEDLPRLLVQKGGKPLNPVQKELLEKIIDTIKKL